MCKCYHRSCSTRGDSVLDRSHVDAQREVTNGPVNEATTGSGIPEESRHKGDTAEVEVEQK